MNDDYLENLKKERNTFIAIHRDQIFAPQFEDEGIRLLHGMYLGILQDAINVLTSLIEFLERES